MTQFLKSFENLPPEKQAGWGFEQHGFTINDDGHIAIDGRVYEFSGQIYPRILPWLSSQLGVADLFQQQRIVSTFPPEVTVHPHAASVLAVLRDAFPDDGADDTADEGGGADDGGADGDNAYEGADTHGSMISTDPMLRLRLAHGHTMNDIYAIHCHDTFDAPDVVFSPSSREQIDAIIALATEHQFQLIPVGGATNVSLALEGHHGHHSENPEDAPVRVAVSTRRMNRILAIDRVNNTAHIEAGAIGRDIVYALEKEGYVLGHEPDSIEFSTLGGWIATRASGMKKNRYGNIEDLIVDVEWVTPMGTVQRTTNNPRESVLVDPNALILGSEGRYGIITSAVVRIFKRPETVAYESVAFASFAPGFDFMYALQQSGDVPASVRLVDTIQFQFSQLLKPAPTGSLAVIAKAKSTFQRWFITRVKGFDLNKMAACTIVYEGSAREVANQQATVKKLAAQFGGVLAGSDNARRGYALTFTIAYLRDFLFPYGVLGESFETSVAWDKAPALWQAVVAEAEKWHAEMGLPGKIIVTVRATQIYATGVTLYFYLGFQCDTAHADLSPIDQFAHIEHRCREVILAHGGSLSHHHGIGALRRGFLDPTNLRTQTADALKQWFDPQGVLLD
ncbi:MAG: FAD-binding oxidoreductase [Alphaproteobacteria bacterium]|nr:FAD-binding oxidoreductase [Alphaproteobacteria bacterium]